MASTADIQVNANRGRTTQELHREALPERWGRRGGFREEEEVGGVAGETKQEVQVTGLLSLSLSSTSPLMSKATWGAAVANTFRC